MRVFIKIILCFYVFSIQAQSNLNYERSIIKKLCSPNFKGRGYTGKGMLKSGRFIAKEFLENNLIPIHKNYLQYFYHSVTEIKKTNLEINQNQLIPGKDYLVNASSPCVKINLKNAVFKRIRNRLELAFKTPIQFNFVEKLTWSPSKKIKDTVKITILKKHEALFRNRRNMNILVKSKFHKKFKSQNVIGLKKGKVDSTIVLMAHYDHLGKMGKTLFPGANDNASGIAQLLKISSYYKNKTPKYNILFIAFGSEEIGLLGSKYFIENQPENLNYKFYINLDISGIGEEGIKIVNSKIYTKEYQILKKINTKTNYVKALKKRGEACNSDHCWFHLNGIKGFYFYTLGGAKHYHDIYDTYENLSLFAFDGITKLICDFIEEL